MELQAVCSTDDKQILSLAMSQIDPDPAPRIHSCTSNRPWLPGVLALALCALLVVNWIGPVGFRLHERSLDAPVLFGTLSLLSACGLATARHVRKTWQRQLLRSLCALTFVPAVCVGCISVVFRVDALPVAHTSVGSDRVVAYWRSGGAVGPHFTEFREERSIAPGLLLTRALGDSPYIGDVTLSIVSGNTLRAVVAYDTERGSRDRFECRVVPLLPW